MIGPSRESKIAIMIPCWDEEAMIEQMLEYNLGAIDYENYDIWLGVYPNDGGTLARAVACAETFSRVCYVWSVPTMGRPPRPTASTGSTTGPRRRSKETANPTASCCNTTPKT